MSTCRSCRASVLWTQTESGKKMPVDELPVPGGNIRLDRSTDPPTAYVVGVVIGSNGSPAMQYRSHFVSCAHGRTWRKSK